MLRDLYNNLDIVHVLHADINDNTAQVGAIVDHRGVHGSMYSIHPGTLADADATFTVLLEEGDDPGLSDAAAVADKDMLGTEAGASFQFDDDNTPKKIGYIGSKRYTRLTITPAANAGAASVSVTAIQKPHLRPAV